MTSHLICRSAPAVALHRIQYDHGRLLRLCFRALNGLVDRRHIMAGNTGKDVETVTADCERDNFMTAEEAKEYGIIDKVYTSRSTQSEK